MAYTGRVDAAWEGIFMLLVLKIPLIYLAVVVWWAIRAEPIVDGGSDGDGALVPLTPCGWDDWKRGRRSGRGVRPIRPNHQVPMLRARRARVAAS
jgi:hypothetical protein